MVHEVCKRGGKTAKVNYGCRGFACNHNVDLWRKTAPVIGESNYMYAPLCGVWLANEIYEHYLNGGLDAERDTVLEIVRRRSLSWIIWWSMTAAMSVAHRLLRKLFLIETGAARLAYTARLKTVWRGRRL